MCVPIYARPIVVVCNSVEADSKSPLEMGTVCGVCSELGARTFPNVFNASVSELIKLPGDWTLRYMFDDDGDS